MIIFVRFFRVRASQIINLALKYFAQRNIYQYFPRIHRKHGSCIHVSQNDVIWHVMSGDNGNRF